MTTSDLVEDAAGHPQLAKLEQNMARIEALLRAYLSFGIEQSELYRNALMFVRPTSVEQPEKRPLSEFAFPSLLLAAIKQGQAEGTVISEDPEILVQILWSGVHGALALPVNMDRLALASAALVLEQAIEGLMRSIRDA